MGVSLLEVIVKSVENRKMFRDDLCRECGICLSECVYLGLNQEQAVQAIQRLKSGEGDKGVLKNCISCFACNAFCPNDAHPYELILSYWHRRYQEKGLPQRALYLTPHAEPNFRTRIIPTMDDEDRYLIDAWRREDPKGKTILYPGCNLLTLPYLARTELLSDLPVAGGFDLCCGEMYFRMGLFDKVREVAARLTEYYKRHNPKRMVFICPACYNMFTNILPGQFGASFSFQTQLLTDYLLEKIDKGEIILKNKLSLKVTVHDSCHARVMKNGLMESARELLKRLGCTILEMKHNTATGYCCGVAAGCSSYSGWDMTRESLRAMREAKRSGADILALYCSGCLVGLSVVGKIYPSALDNYHLLELVQMAIGEKPMHRHKRYSGQILKGIIRHAIPGYLSRKRIKLPVIDKLE